MLTKEEEAELIESNWSHDQKEMFEVCEHLRIDYDVDCFDILDLIDKSNPETEDALLLAWTDIREIVRSCSFNLTDFRKFVNESMEDITLVLETKEIENEVGFKQGGFHY